MSFFNKALCSVLLCALAAWGFPRSAAASCGACYVPRSESPEEYGSGEITSGPMIYSPTASTLGKNHASLGFTFDHLRYNSLPASNAHQFHHEGHDVHGKRHEEIYDIHAGYGVLQDLDVYLSAPVVSRTSTQVDSHRDLGRTEHSAGFGDMRLIGKYRFWKKHVEAALIAGVKFPTGYTSDKDKAGAKFESEQQPGSGSWDGQFGVALSRSFKRRISVASSFQYALRTEGAQQHEMGDLFDYSFGTSYAFRELGKYPNVSVSVEMNNRWALRDRSRTVKKVQDSGGTAIFVTPGVYADLTKNVTAFWGMPVPVYQNLGGEHEELKFEILAGLSLHV